MYYNFVAWWLLYLLGFGKHVRFIDCSFKLAVGDKAIAIGDADCSSNGVHRVWSLRKRPIKVTVKGCSFEYLPAISGQKP